MNAQVNLTGNTPLMLAATIRCCPCAQLLLKHRATFEAKNDKGKATLAQAVENKATDM